MKEIKKILFPTDFSPTAQNAFRYALQFADLYDASIQLLNVVHPEYEGIDIPVMSASITQTKFAASEEAIKAFIDFGLAQVGEKIKQVPVTNTKIEIGGPSILIRNVAKEMEADLIIMGTKETHHVLERIFGSVTTDVIGNAPCHVLVIPEKAVFHRMKKVLYATDFSEASAFHIWNAIRLLQKFQAEYHILHVDRGTETTLSLEDLSGFLAQNAPDLDLTFHVSSGDDVTENLENFLHTHDMDLLVMHAPNRGLIEKMFHKSATKHMVLHTETPLLIYREEGI